MIQLTPNDKKFIEKIRCDLQDEGFALQIGTDDETISGYNYSGYFSPCDMVIFVGRSMRDKSFLPIITHEYCHFLQYRDRNNFFNRHSDISLAIKYLGGKTLRYSKNVAKHLKNLILIEYDAELMTLQIIRKHKLSINIPRYKQQINARLSRILYCMIHKRGGTDYKKIWENVPYNYFSTMLINFANMKLPKSIEHMFDETVGTINDAK